MREIQDIKRLLYPLVKALPWILIFMTTSMVVAWRFTNYQIPVYESHAVILLDDRASGFSDNNLYEDLDIFSETNNVLTEVQVVKSKVILLEALKRMPTNIEYYRVGKLRTSELYDDEAPFLVTVDTNNFTSLNELISIEILNIDSFNLFISNDTLTYKFGDYVNLDGYHLTIDKKPNWLLKHDETNFLGNYLFRVNTPLHLLSNFVKGNLFVKELDKNVAVIQIHFEGENPRRVADFTNAVAASYLDDHTLSKMRAAQLTEIFLDERTQATKKSLNVAESNLENYRVKNRVFNLKQETETDFRKISQLELQAVNLQLELTVLDSLIITILNDEKNFLDIAPSYEAYGGMIFSSLISKIKNLEAQRTDLLLKYSENSLELKTVDQKIEDLIQYIINNIQSHRDNTSFQISKLSLDIQTIQYKMNLIPKSEKQLIMLKRDFTQQQDLFNFLKRKEMEAGIAKLANLHFHRVIDKAEVATTPSSPNKGFNIALGGFLSLLISVAFVYILEGILSKISSRFELEKLTEVKVLGVVKHNAFKYMDESFTSLISELLPIVKSKKGFSISITSAVATEGKSYISQHLAITLASLGYKVLFIDLNNRTPGWKKLIPEFSKELTLENYFSGKLNENQAIQDSVSVNLSVCGFGGFVDGSMIHLSKDFDERLKLLKSKHEVIIFDTPAYTILPEVKTYIKHTDFTIFVIRNNFTSSKYIRNIDDVAVNIGIEKVGIVLNEVPKGVNYSGNFYGSRYMYDQPKGLIAKVKHYWDSYKNAWTIE